MKQRMREPKDLSKKIRLIMNMIAPDTFEKKEQEIKDLMFKSAEKIKGKKKKGFIIVDAESLSQIVSSIFLKAQAERDYGRMYAQLCQNLIKEELARVGEPKMTKKSILKSSFRQSLL